jgi:hypothetical protein
MREYITIPKAQDQIALPCEITGAGFVVDLLILVLNAIYFDDQLRICSAEVSYVTTHDNLAPEADAFEAAIAERGPEAFFSIGGVAAEGAGAHCHETSMRD